MDTINLNSLLQIIVAHGDDVKSFLQGQLTNDINLLDSNINYPHNSAFQFSAYLNTKGRILATFFVVKVMDNRYYLITTKSVANKVFAKLQLYVLRSKVSLELLNSNIIFTDNLHGYNNHTNVKLPNNHYLILDNHSHNENSPIHNAIEQFKLYLINNGIGFIYQETEEEFIPQHVNFDKLNGLNFKKGCYLGQEIVARMHYLGRSKRSMYRFTTTHMITIGNKVISPKMANQQVGTIVEVCRLGNNMESGNYVGLVSVQDDCKDDIYFNDGLNNYKLEINVLSYK